MTRPTRSCALTVAPSAQCDASFPADASIPRHRFCSLECPSSPARETLADWRGFHIMMEYDGRILLGSVVSVEALTLRLGVRHFNGDYWPVEPIPADVRVLWRLS